MLLTTFRGQLSGTHSDSEGTEEVNLDKAAHAGRRKVTS